MLYEHISPVSLKVMEWETQAPWMTSNSSPFWSVLKVISLISMPLSLPSSTTWMVHFQYRSDYPIAPLGTLHRHPWWIAWWIKPSCFVNSLLALNNLAETCFSILRSCHFQTFILFSHSTELLTHFQTFHFYHRLLEFTLTVLTTWNSSFAFQWIPMFP